MDNCIDILDMANKHICTFCVKSIISSRKLATHFLTHIGEKSHKCAQCNKSFSLAAHLKTHLLCHIEERKHPCAQCDKSSRHAGNLKAHLLVQAGIPEILGISGVRAVSQFLRCFIYGDPNMNGNILRDYASGRCFALEDI